MNYLTEQQSTDLITKLSTDDDFRVAFTEDPAAILSEYYDVTLDSSDIPADPIVLPSKQEFYAEFNGYVSHVNESLGCMMIHIFKYEPDPEP